MMLVTSRRCVARTTPFALAAALSCTLSAAAWGQATIRSRDLVDDWTSIPTAAAAQAKTAYVPSWNSQPNSWRLGVGIENLETGVLLTDVERGMPADRAGLKRGDVISCVGGYQVGYVGGALFDLGDELHRRVDDQGRVTMLIFDNQNRQIRSLPVTLVQQSAAGVRGQVVCKERITLTPQAVLTVRLRDVTYSSWQNVEVGKHVIPNPPHPPIPFSIEYDPTAIYPDHKYAVDAWLVDRGQIVLQSSTPLPVTPLAGSTALQVSLVRTSASVPPNSTYAVGQVEQISGWYRQYLGRDASSQELAAWQAHLQAGRAPQDILTYILSSPEYFDRMGNQRDRYLADVYRNVYGRQPTSADLQQMATQYQQYDGQRSQFVRDVLRMQPSLQ
jgi:uncharacterized lipoprotein YbaY